MREPTNITIELFKGDPTKGHHGWGVVARFTDHDTGDEIVVTVPTKRSCHPLFGTVEVALVEMQCRLRALGVR